MRVNLRLVQASQFPQQFKLNIYNKSDKEYIILDTLSRLASGNTWHPNLQHSELDALFTYNTTLVKIYPALVFQILAIYKVDSWRVRLQ